MLGIHRWDGCYKIYDAMPITEIEPLDFEQYGIDHIWCINLNRRPDRWRYISNQLFKIGLDVERFSAIDGMMIGVENKFEGFEGVVGCRLSHLAVIEESLNRGYEHVLIMEDDCTIAPHIDNVQNFLATIGYDWDWINFNIPIGNPWNKIDEFDTHRISDRSVSTHLYGLSSRFMSEIVDNSYGPLPTDISLHVDIFISNIGVQHGIRCMSPKKMVPQDLSLGSNLVHSFPDAKLSS